MKFIIYLSFIILSLTPLITIDCKLKSGKKLSSRKNPIRRPQISSGASFSAPSHSSFSSPSHSFSSAPSHSFSTASTITNVQRPYSSVVSRPQNYVQSSIGRPSFHSSFVRRPLGGYVRGGFYSRPLFAIRRYAYILRSRTDCPEVFKNNSLIREKVNYCPKACERRFCIQIINISNICCIYSDEVEDGENSIDDSAEIEKDIEN